MKEILVRGKTLPEGYHNALKVLKNEGENCPCPDWNTDQLELSLTMCIEEPLAEPMISRLFIGGFRELEQYRQEMLDGILDFEVEKGNWEYTYHLRFADQLPFIAEDLRRNPYSRRAAISIRTPDDIGSGDPACMQHLQYFIRDGKLHGKVLFRSNDACKATYMNAFALIMLQKRLADELGVPMGSYTHRANSFHCYRKDIPMLEGYVARIDGAEDMDDITYEYEDNWRDLMESVQPELSAMVADLKAR